MAYLLTEVLRVESPGCQPRFNRLMTKYHRPYKELGTGRSDKVELSSHVFAKYLPGEFRAELRCHVFGQNLPAEFRAEVRSHIFGQNLPGEFRAELRSHVFEKNLPAEFRALTLQPRLWQVFVAGRWNLVVAATVSRCFRG